MHGRIKVRTTAEQEELKKVERAKKVVEYRTAIDFIFQKRKQKIWDDELFVVIEKMLLRNPDIYTLWNIRREGIMKNELHEEKYKEQLERELTLTESCLRENPKSYSVWHHRCWVIDHFVEPNYKKELFLCAKCLNIDERNFHCWDYRNFIVQKAGVPDSEEFEFSTSKILNNFSNYSSWHYRSKILSKMFPDITSCLPIKDDKHNEELDLVMNATFTDPNDTSAWFYQRWLLECCKPSTRNIWRAQLTKEEVTIVFHEEVSIQSAHVSLSVEGEVLDCQWESHNNEKFSKIWRTTFKQFLNIVENSNIFLEFENETYDFSYLNNVWICRTKVSQIEKYNEAQLREQLVNYKQLFEMEPQNKWALLTGIFLMKSIDYVGFHSNILSDFDLLMKVDKLRYNYYKDLRSKCLIDYYLRHFWTDENEDPATKQVDLSGLGLTTLYKENYFSFLEEVNLGANDLANSLHRLYSLRECKKLSLSSNSIRSTKTFPTLPKLKILSLRNNEISSIEDVLNLVKRHDLLELDLRENPICKFDVKEKIETIYSSMNVKV